MQCAICVEDFNRSKRKQVECPYCPKEDTTHCCATCVKQYLLQDDASTPRCPACRSGWTEDFLTATFAKTWLLKEYKAHREQVLLDMERARLPEAQEDAARYRTACELVDRIQAAIDPIQTQIRALPEYAEERAAMEAYRVAWEQRRIAERERLLTPDGMDVMLEARAEVERAWRAMMDAQNAYVAARAPLQQQITALRTREYMRAARLKKSYGRVLEARQQSERPQAWTFVMKCTKEGCEGFVGTNWNCGLCETAFCKDCGEAVREDHMCDPDVKATHEALRKEAKPCPKCAAMISKVDGCDQMWCTQCRTAFSWRTGQIETAHVHNPHYFQWMRTVNLETPLPQPGNCLHLEPEELLEQIVHYARRRRQWGILEWGRVIRHNRMVLRGHQRSLETRQEEDWRRVLRVRRLVNEITDATWKDRLQRGEKATQKEFAVTQVLEVFTQAGLDILRESLLEDADIPALLAQLDSLHTYCNGSLLKIQQRYNNEVDYIENPQLRIQAREGRV